MTGSSSTWYAISARFSRSRSSAARARASEMLKQFLGGVDDRVRLLALQPLPVVDATPRDGDRVHARGLRRADVERRVAHVRSLDGLGVHPCRGEEQWLRIGLVLLRLVAAHDGLEQMRDGHPRKRELDRETPLRGHDSEAVALRMQAQEHILHAD